MTFPRLSTSVPHSPPPTTALSDTSSSSSPPALSHAHRSRGGRYEHLGDVIAGDSQSTARSSTPRSIGTNLTQAILADGEAATSAQTVASTSRPVRPAARSRQIANLAQLARLAEMRPTNSIDLVRTSGVHWRGNELRDATARIKAGIERSLANFDVPMTGVVEGDHGVISTNMNHLEHREYLRGSIFPEAPFHEKLSKLGTKADRYLLHHQELGRPRPEPLPDLHGKRGGAVLKRLLDERPGVILGEAHSCSASKRLLVKHMDELKRQGVSTLFLEHLCADSHGSALDDYLRAPAGSPMPARLAAYLKLQDRGNTAFGQAPSRYGFVDLVKAAKDAGIKVVPLDTAATYSASEQDGDLRIRVMNFYAAERIRLEEPPGKWVAFVGSAHATRYQGVPGLDELTGTRSLIVDDFGSDKRPKVTTNVRGYADGQLDPDVVLSYKRNIA